MSPAQWIVLARRCEQASGPDREVDAAIWAAYSVAENYAVSARLSENRRGFVVTYFAGGTHGTSSAPAYTHSLDSAIRLVPEACYPWVQFGRNKGLEPERGWFGHVGAPDSWDRQRAKSEWFCVAMAATPALALTAAALRARACLEDGQ